MMSGRNFFMQRHSADLGRFTGWNFTGPPATGIGAGEGRSMGRFDDLGRILWFRDEQGRKISPTRFGIAGGHYLYNPHSVLQ